MSDGLNRPQRVVVAIALAVALVIAALLGGFLLIVPGVLEDDVALRLVKLSLVFWAADGLWLVAGIFLFDGDR